VKSPFELHVKYTVYWIDLNQDSIHPTTFVQTYNAKLEIRYAD